MRLGLCAAAVVTCAVGAAVGPSIGLADQSAPAAALTPAEALLLESGAPVDILLDPSTGVILSVTAANPDPIPDISAQSGCAAGDGCYLTNKVPYANEGFYGAAGTYSGSWVYRSGYSAGSYDVSACWIGGCGPKIYPGSKVTFTSDVTGTSFTIY